LLRNQSPFLDSSKSKEPRPQGGALRPKFSKPKIEIPKQVRDDSKTGTKPSCHAKLVSASGLLFSAFGDVVPRVLKRKSKSLYILIHRG
jgi:hypothetical protein